MKNKTAWAVILVTLGVVMLRDPKCTRGCRTLAERLPSHGIEDFLAGLGA